jgi:hypothetical protein
MAKLPLPLDGVADSLAPLRQFGTLRVTALEFDSGMGHLAVFFVASTPLEDLLQQPPCSTAATGSFGSSRCWG